MYSARGVNLVKVGKGWCFRTASDLASHMTVEREVPRKLSRAAIETLAIIAYHQPVTRAEVEEVRGVALSKGSMDALLEAAWIRPRGRRRAPGKPVTWGTTERFLADFGLESLDDLPGVEELKAAGLLDSRPNLGAIAMQGTDTDDEAQDEEDDERTAFLENDATTACGAELIFGRQNLPADFLHIYIAHFPGGGLVLDGKLRFGPQRNAAALGSILVPDGGQLLERASVASLEARLGRAVHPDDSAWDVPEAIEAEWAEQAGRALAFVSLAAVSIADLPLVVIDGAVPPATRARLVAATRHAMTALPREGIVPPEVIAGSLGRNARVLGAAALPLSHFFQPDGQLG